MAFIRKIKKGDAIYLAKVESYREAGKVKQRVLEYVGKEENGIAIQKVDINKIEVENVKHYTDVTVLYQLSQELKLPELLGKHNKSILALLIAHLLCKGSIVKINRWIDNSTIKETLRLPTLTLEMLYSALDYLEEMDFDTIEQSIHAVASPHQGNHRRSIRRHGQGPGDTRGCSEVLEREPGHRSVANADGEPQRVR